MPFEVVYLIFGDRQHPLTPGIPRLVGPHNVSGKALAPFFEDESTSNPKRGFERSECLLGSVAASGDYVGRLGQDAGREPDMAKSRPAGKRGKTQVRSATAHSPHLLNGEPNGANLSPRSKRS